MTIPRILHQTWKTDSIPEKFRAWSESWDKHNPGWQRILWSDRMLLDFVAENYPDLLPVYSGYSKGVERADAARYMLLHHFGGVYADLDCECLAPFEPLLTEDRVVLCKEPVAHAHNEIRTRNLPYLLFNGTIASPKGHAFWNHVLARLPVTGDSNDVLDATGPCFLTGAQLSFSDQASLTIHPSTLFSPMDKDGDASQVPPGAGSLSHHHWSGTWYTPERSPTALQRLRGHLYRLRHEVTKGQQLNPMKAQAAVNRSALERPAPGGDNIAILIPLRDAADLIEPSLAALARLEHPKERIKLVFCEGDSVDGSWDRLVDATAPLKSQYREVILLRKSVGTAVERAARQHKKVQRARRAAIASVRNELIRNGLDASDDWALWIDIDVWSYPPDIIARLIDTGRRIVVPNCTNVPGGKSFDLNSFASVSNIQDRRYWKYMRDGLYQPPVQHGRLYLSDFRALESVNLDSVGGTMLLVDAALHRGGLTFPETPYKCLIETEGFAALANDLGIVPLGLPQVEILHVPW